MKLFLQVLVKEVNYLGHCSLVAVWFLSSTSQIQDEKFLKMLKMLHPGVKFFTSCADDTGLPNPFIL